jgi:hypothetical protein
VNLSGGDTAQPRVTWAEQFVCSDASDSAGGCRLSGTKFLDPEARAARHCCLPDFDTNTWNGENLVQIRMGAPADFDSEDENPAEDIEHEGCPGAWYRSEFIDSLLKYHRRVDDNGGRVSDHAYSSVADPFVQQCLRALETQEDSFRGYRMNYGRK